MHNRINSNNSPLPHESILNEFIREIFLVIVYGNFEGVIDWVSELVVANSLAESRLLTMLAKVNYFNIRISAGIVEKKKETLIKNQIIGSIIRSLLKIYPGKLVGLLPLNLFDVQDQSDLHPEQLIYDFLDSDYKDSFKDSDLIKISKYVLSISATSNNFHVFEVFIYLKYLIEYLQTLWNRGIIEGAEWIEERKKFINDLELNLRKYSESILNTL
ncbi:MAG: hypothetical protein AAGA10_27985 [Bacteroidota bacterium]